jgi:hypothetical protein
VALMGQNHIGSSAWQDGDGSAAYTNDVDLYPDIV